MKMTAHGLKRRTAAAAADLRRGRADATQDDDANTWHRRLPLVPAKLLDSFSSTAWRRGGGTTAAALG
jgi:hypothetical protein